jgi:ribonuclease HI
MMTRTDIFNPEQGVIVYTDGSASTKDRTGGWAWIALDCDNGLIEESGGEEDTTISRMELTAAIMALEFLSGETGANAVLVISDSKYVVDGFNDKTRARNKNGDLWNYLEEAVLRFYVVEFEHVKGHDGDYWNERADKAAGAARAVIVESKVQPKKG